MQSVFGIFSVHSLSIHNHNLKKKKNEFQQKLNEHFVCFIKNAALFSFFQFILVFSRSETSWVIFVVYFTWLFFSVCNFALFPCCDFCSYILHVCETKLHFFLNECSRAALKIYFPSSNTTKRNRNSFLATVNARFDMQYFNFLRFGYRLTVSNHFSFEQKCSWYFFMM